MRVGVDRCGCDLQSRHSGTQIPLIGHLGAAAQTSNLQLCDCHVHAYCTYVCTRDRRMLPSPLAPDPALWHAKENGKMGFHRIDMARQGRHESCRDGKCAAARAHARQYAGTHTSLAPLCSHRFRERCSMLVISLCLPHSSQPCGGRSLGGIRDNLLQLEVPSKDAAITPMSTTHGPQCSASLSSAIDAFCCSMFRETRERPASCHRSAA